MKSNKVLRREELDKERFKVFMAVHGRHNKCSVNEISLDTGLESSVVYRHWSWLNKRGAFNLKDGSLYEV